MGGVCERLRASVGDPGLEQIGQNHSLMGPLEFNDNIAAGACGAFANAASAAIYAMSLGLFAFSMS